MSPENALAEPLDFVCPRCSLAASEKFYGPCGNCREQLRAQHGTAGRAITEELYEPKMNVTPNAVALKDD